MTKKDITKILKNKVVQLNALPYFFKCKITPNSIRLFDYQNVCVFDKFFKTKSKSNPKYRQTYFANEKSVKIFENFGDNIFNVTTFTIA